MGMNIEHKKKILIVEDEKPLRRLFVETALLKEFEVLEAKDGREGLEIALKEHPDLIVLDLIMPVSDGISMLKKLRDDAWGKTAAVLAWSAYGNEESEREVKNLQVKDFLDKHDWGFKDVVNKIKKSIG